MQFEAIISAPQSDRTHNHKLWFITHSCFIDAWNNANPYIMNRNIRVCFVIYFHTKLWNSYLYFIHVIMIHEIIICYESYIMLWSLVAPCIVSISLQKGLIIQTYFTLKNWQTDRIIQPNHTRSCNKVSSSQIYYYPSTSLSITISCPLTVIIIIHANFTIALIRFSALLGQRKIMTLTHLYLFVV